MERFAWGTSQETPVGRPDMTVLEAAESMERFHGRNLLVRSGDRVVGYVSEDDIIRKVLNEGLRPDVVRVSDIMHSGTLSTDGSLLFESEPSFTLWTPESRRGPAILRGFCEECGDHHEDLLEIGGIGFCSGCAPLRA